MNVLLSWSFSIQYSNSISSASSTFSSPYVSVAFNSTVSSTCTRLCVSGGAHNHNGDLALTVSSPPAKGSSSCILRVSISMASLKGKIFPSNPLMNFSACSGFSNVNTCGWQHAMFTVVSMTYHVKDALIVVFMKKSWQISWDTSSPSCRCRSNPQRAQHD